MVCLVSKLVEANIHIDERNYMLIGKFISVFQTRIALTGVDHIGHENPGVPEDKTYRPFELTSINYLSQRITSHRRMRLSSILAKEFYPTGKVPHSVPAYAMEPLGWRVMVFWCNLASNQYLRGHVLESDTVGVIEAVGTISLEYAREVWRLLCGEGVKDGVMNHGWDTELGMPDLATRRGISWLGYSWKDGRVNETKVNLEAHKKHDMTTFPRLRPSLSHFRSYVRVLVSWREWDDVERVVTDELLREYVLPLGKMGMRKELKHGGFVRGVLEMVKGDGEKERATRIKVFWQGKGGLPAEKGGRDARRFAIESGSSALVRETEPEEAEEKVMNSWTTTGLREKSLKKAKLTDDILGDGKDNGTRPLSGDQEKKVDTRFSDWKPMSGGGNSIVTEEAERKNERRRKFKAWKPMSGE